MIGNISQFNFETMTAEEYFDSIYTYHANDYVRMPLNELYELMEGYLKAHNKALNISAVSVSLLERAASLVGNPGTNISGGIDVACYLWQKDYERWRNER